MASIYDMAMGTLDSYAQGQQTGRQNRLRDLMGQAVSGPRENRKALLGHAAQVDPMASLKFGQAMREDDGDRMGQVAKIASLIDSAPEDQKATIYAQVAPEMNALGIPVPQQWDASFAPHIRQIAQAYGGAQQQELRPHVVGNALVDASGKVLYQGEAPEKWQLVQVPDGQGGSVQMEYSNGQWRQPTYGGAPQPTQGVTGGGGQVLDDAYRGAQVDPVTDFPTLVQKYPGVQVSSLARSPEHNAKVGGVANSYHVKGQGGDFVVPMAQRQQFMAEARQMGYDAIDEGDHVHLEPRRGAQASSRFEPGQGIGGQRMGYTPPKPAGPQKAPARQMTPQEVAAAGLAPGTVAYMGESGVPNVVQRPESGNGMPKLSAGEAAKVRRDFKETKDALNMFRAFDSALTDLPSGVGLVTDGAAKGRLGTAYNNARSSLRILYNTGVLQPGELPMLENALRDPTSPTAIMDPRTRPQIKAQLNELYRVIDRNIQNQVYSYPQVFNPQKFEQARDAAMSRGKPSGNAPTITTKAQYDALPSGALFIEDGRQYRKP